MKQQIQQNDHNLSRRRRLHELLLALIQKQNDIELMDTETPSLDRNASNFKDHDPASWLVRNRRVIKHYQALVKTAITLDALLDAEHDGTG